MHPLWPDVQAFHPQLWRAVCGYELNHAVREELLQEVLLAIWESLPRLRDPQMLLPFVLRIAHNMGASHVRSETRKPSAVPFDEALHDVPDPAAGAGCAGALAGFGGGVVAGRGAGASAGGGVVAAGAGGVVGLAKATLAGTGAEGSATATGGLFAGGAASSAARAAKNARHAGSTELGSDE